VLVGRLVLNRDCRESARQTKHGQTHIVSFFIAVGLIASLVVSRVMPVRRATRNDDIVRLAPTVIRDQRLVLHSVVSSIGKTFNYGEAVISPGNYSGLLKLLSIPAAYVGGYLSRYASVLRILIGV